MDIKQMVKEKLGHTVKDRVTGMEGIITSICFDLYGCVQGLIAEERAGDLIERFWLDIHRLEVTNPNPVMDLPIWCREPEEMHAYPVFDKGPADKPVY